MTDLSEEANHGLKLVAFSNYEKPTNDLNGQETISVFHNFNGRKEDDSMKLTNLKKLNFREAKASDIKQIQVVRNSVNENILTVPDLVTDEHCLDFITSRGKGWVCEIDNRIVGFSIVDLKERNIWALFVGPNYEKKGIGKQLHNIMLNWYFDQTSDNIWLSTDPKTRAETFYRKLGWTQIGTFRNGEIKFQMTYKNWKKYSR